MDKHKCTVLRVKLQELFAVFADDLKKEFNVAVKIGKAKYTPGQLGNVEFSVELAEIGTGGIIETKEASMFRVMATSYGFAESDLGRQFVRAQKTYTIKGVAPKSRKFPIICTCQDGKDYGLPANDVLRGIGKPIKDYGGEDYRDNF